MSGSRKPRSPANWGSAAGRLREALGRLENRLVTRTPRVGVSVIQMTEKDLRSYSRSARLWRGWRAAMPPSGSRDDELVSLEAAYWTGTAPIPRCSAPTGYYQRSQNEDFHFQIVRCSRNERLEHLLMEELYYQLRLYRFQASTQPGRAETAFQEHQAIFERCRLATRTVPRRRCAPIFAMPCIAFGRL